MPLHFVCIYLFSFLMTGFHYVAQADLELVIFLPQPPECWDYRHTLPWLATNTIVCRSWDMQ
jgi:hypothetical protein